MNLENQTRPFLKLRTNSLIQPSKLKVILQKTQIVLQKPIYFFNLRKVVAFRFSHFNSRVGKVRPLGQVHFPAEASYLARRVFVVIQQPNLLQDCHCQVSISSTFYARVWLCNFLAPNNKCVSRRPKNYLIRPANQIIAHPILNGWRNCYLVTFKSPTRPLELKGEEKFSFLLTLAWVESALLVRLH